MLFLFFLIRWRVINFKCIFLLFPQILYPIFIGKIPIDRFRKSNFKFVSGIGWFPPQCFDFCCINRITQIISRSIFNKDKHIAWFVHELENKFCNINIISFIVHASIVDFARFTFMQHEIQGITVIIYMDPITNILSIAMNRNRFIFEQSKYRNRNKFFWILEWSIII